MALAQANRQRPIVERVYRVVTEFLGAPSVTPVRQYYFAILCNTWPLFGKVLRHVSLHFYLHLAAANRVAMATHRRVSLHRSHLLNPFVWLHVTLEIFFKRRTTPSSTVLVQVRKTFLKNIVEKKSFPYRESNPSLLGESQLS